MSSRRPEVTAKVQGGSITSLLQNPYGKKKFIESDFNENEKNMHLSCDFQASFSVVWRAFRQFSFKFTTGRS